MILDQLINLDAYKALGIGDRYAKAVEWLKSNDLANLPDGHYEIDGKAVYAGVMSYTTVPWEEAVYEAHKNIPIYIVSSAAQRFCLMLRFLL